MLMEDTSTNVPRPRTHLVNARIAQNWSQQGVADLLGTTHVNVSRWERGITRPGPYFRRKLSKLFELSEEALDLGVQGAAESVAPPSASSPPHSATGSASPIPPPAPVVEALYDPVIPLPPSTQLIGRADEIAAVRQRLFAGGSVALTALNGLPGVGKTSMAIALAHDAAVRAHFKHGILWAGLGPDPNIDQRLIRWGNLLGISTSEIERLKDYEAWGVALRGAIGTRSILLVIDDAWNIDDALAFKVGGPNCAHLVTTRYPTIATQVAGDGATTLSELNDDNSMELLRLLAPQVIGKEEARALDLVHAVGGLPLALTLMGNYLRLQSHSGQTRRIQAALQLLADAQGRMQISEPRGPIERHPSMPRETSLSLQSIIAVTDEQLSDEASAAFYALAVLPSKPDNFSEEAALAVTASSLDTIDTLIDAGLLESSSEGRYMLHQTIADYARLHLQDTEPAERLLQYAHAFVEEHRTDYELLDLESGTILAALETAYELGKHEELVRNVCAFIPHLLVRGNYSLAERHIQRAYEAAVALHDERSTVTTLLYRGQIAQKQGNYTRAETDFQHALTLARKSDDPERISAVLRDLGWVTWRQGNFALAEEYLQEGLTLARQIKDSEQICSILETLGSVVGSQGDYRRETEYLQEGLALARQIENRERICSLLIHLGITVGEQGNYAQAETFFQEGLILARQIGHREWISALLANLGEAASAQEHYAQAEIYFREGMELAEQIGQPEWISILSLNLGLTKRKQEDYSLAKLFLQKSLTSARQLGIPQMTSNVLYEYGNLYLDQKDIASAEAKFHEMLVTTPEECQDLIALAQYGLARVTASRNNLREARMLGEGSIAILASLGHRNAGEVREWLVSIEE
jgi:tetratricopeptide (TPR) repeat protein/transcriptional regulator with XRE-family HTH domain